MYYSDYKHNNSQATLDFGDNNQTPEQRHLQATDHRCYIIRHRYDRILSELRSVIEPYVEVGYDAQQIKDELRKLDSDCIVSLNNIETVISTILGEQA